MGLPKWLNITLQVTAAIIIILILYIVTIYVLNIDSLVVNSGMNVKQKEITTVIDGYAGPSYLYNMEFNTINPFSDNYKRIARSLNENGGASYSYQVWIKVEDADDSLFKDLVIFLKGDKRKYNLAYYNKQGKGAAAATVTTGASTTTAQESSEYILKKQLMPSAYVACPLISFGNSYRELKIRFNTNRDVYNEILIDMKKDAEPSSRKNLLSLVPLNWTLFTFVFEDNYSFMAGGQNGIKFYLYINDSPYWIESASSTAFLRNDFLKQNDGNLYLFPDIKTTTDFVKIANLKYFNYAVQPSEIASAYAKGPPSYGASYKPDKIVKPAYVSALNKVDIYNF